MENNGKKSDFLQSAQWRKFQENAGRKAYFLEQEGFSASVVEHELPIVGNYFYVSRGPLTESNSGLSLGMQEMINVAKKNNVGWIRVEPKNEDVLKIIKDTISEKIVKAPHDMQPKEVFVLDISKPAEQLLAEMKSKTRYNINLAQKRGVSVQAISNFQFPISKQYVDDFLKLTKVMAVRQGISAHPEEYYRKMIETLPADMLKIYVAEYDGKIIAANLVIFYGDMATYLHGASSNEHRNVMAPYLLQWQAILDAKDAGCKYYDLGGIKTSNIKNQTSNDWQGITNFKLGFSPNTQPVVFPGSYDIIINTRKYAVYKGLQRAKMFIKHLGK